MRKLFLVIMVAAATVGLFPLSYHVTYLVKTQTPEAQAPTYRVYVDENTGEILEDGDASALVLSEDLLQRLSQSDADLLEEDSPVEGGGVMVRLEGRYRTLYVGSTARDGKTTGKCIDASDVVVEEGKR